jgi:E3 ubiquitin-protein ligase synoviolin
MLTLPKYSLLSVGVTSYVLAESLTLRQNFYYTVLYLTSSKINILILANFFIVLLMCLYSLLVFVFFSEVRNIEKKYISEQCQRKAFGFLLLAMMLRSSFDIYTLISLSIQLSMSIIYWLVHKRSEYVSPHVSS